MSYSARSLLALSLFSFLLAYCVVILGAYVRLSNAGLGCPDWPGCYGKLFVTGDASADLVEKAHLDRPFDEGKAMKEMIHRYAAGGLGLALLLLAFSTWRTQHPQKRVAYLLLGLVVLQALLGMWTVTELLKPAIVSAHLIGGMLILALLYWLILKQLPFGANNPGQRSWVAGLSLACLSALAVQIFLGGWTSANYAALACPEFPGCRDGLWWPETDFKEAFVLWREGKIDYEGGILDAPARTAIHLAHRSGAVVTVLMVLAVVIGAFRQVDSGVRFMAVVLLCIACVQVALGVANVLLRLPLPIAVAHNAVAALLMLSLLTLYAYSRSNPPG